ncbi:MAG TPA: monofunctional biosynthetic peptidoglycan transglycosylase [Candidatus Nitrosotenuis sp.]|nr:monofunctional biosynthetic peptidoglycan transglycosylase [Candidatus Nitrosotenuis sp.]
MRILAAGAVLALSYEAWIFAQVWRLRAHNPETTAFMEQGLARLRAKNPKRKLRQQWVPYEKISVHLKRAVLAAEDQNFLVHRGFDWDAIREAYERNQSERRSIHGGSTITQQLAKNLFLSPRRTYFRKAQEAVITVMLEAVLPKRRILEIYLNVIEWGEGIYGAEAAAQHFFGVSAAALDPEQSARLATVIPAPRRYSPLRESEFMHARIAFIESQKNFVAVP